MWLGRWIIENDWLEAIIALPDQLFYNTNINTYLWILSNIKDRERKGKIALIDAREMFVEMKKSLGQKRKEISDKQIEEIRNLYTGAMDGGKVKIFDNEDFGYRKITIDRPLRMKFVISEEGISKISSDKAFEKAKNVKQKAIDQQSQMQEPTLNLLHQLKGMEFRTKSDFEDKLSSLLLSKGLKLSAAQRKALLKIFGVRDENAEIALGSDGKPEADTDMRDYENVPLKEDINVYFNREVKPFLPDAWINESVRDIKNGKVGKVGYEIPFNRYFYKFVPPRPLEEIDVDLKQLGDAIIDLLKEVTE